MTAAAPAPCGVTAPLLIGAVTGLPTGRAGSGSGLAGIICSRYDPRPPLTGGRDVAVDAGASGCNNNS